VTLTVAGKVVTGEVQLERETEIRGTVWEDGSFGATVGFSPLNGQFSRDAFEGVFETSDCAWKILLKRRPGQ
jgi:FAD synthase